MNDYANVAQRHPVKNAVPVGWELLGMIALLGSPVTDLPR